MTSDEMTIVLAADHPTVSHGLPCELEKDSRVRELAVAADGEQALQAVRQFKPDVIILDIDMPGLEGFRVATQLHTQLHNEAFSGKVVIHKVHGETSFLKNAFRLGAAGFILKDSALAEILTGINTICSGETYFSPWLLPQSRHRTQMKPPAKSSAEPLHLILLTPTEQAVLGLIAECCSTREIADRSPFILASDGGRTCWFVRAGSSVRLIEARQCKLDPCLPCLAKQTCLQIPLRFQGTRKNEKKNETGHSELKKGTPVQRMGCPRKRNHLKQQHGCREPGQCQTWRHTLDYHPRDGRLRLHNGCDFHADGDLPNDYAQSSEFTGQPAECELQPNAHGEWWHRPYSYVLSSGTLPPGLNLTSGGVLLGTTTQNGSFTFTITATDTNGCAGTRSYAINVSCPGLTVNPNNPTLTAGTGGTDYTQPFTQTGGAGTITWCNPDGGLPGGLMLNSATGLLSGTPNAAGSFTFTIRATEASNCTGARTYTLQIACPGITVNPALLPAGHLNLAYSAVPLSASGGTGPYSFAVTAGVLPAGLLLNGSPGRPHKPACSRSR